MSRCFRDTWRAVPGAAEGKLILDIHFILILRNVVSCALPFLQGRKRSNNMLVLNQL